MTDEQHKKNVEAHREFLRHRRAGLTRKQTRTTKEILSGDLGRNIMNINQRRQLLGKAGKLRKKSQEHG